MTTVHKDVKGQTTDNAKTAFLSDYYKGPLKSIMDTYFKKLAEKLSSRQVIYLGGIANEDELSEHLSSRKSVEDILKSPINQG